MKLKFNLPYPCVKRNDLGKLTGGLLHPKTIRNLDSKGQGIRGKFLISARTVAYPTEAVLEFIESKLKTFNSDSDNICEVCND